MKVRRKARRNGRAAAVEAAAATAAAAAATRQPRGSWFTMATAWFSSSVWEGCRAAASRDSDRGEREQRRVIGAVIGCVGCGMCELETRGEGVWDGMWVHTE
jgi:hypothetical protein